MTDDPSRAVGPDDLDECWCCGGFHDSYKALCPACDEAGCSHFGGECQADHQPVIPDGGSPNAAIEHRCPDCERPIRLIDPEKPEWCPYCGVRL